MVQQYVSNDNSMMVMINSVSKSSMLKNPQQTACVGLQLPASKFSIMIPSLQLPASKFSFMIPSQLSCLGWNNKKLSDWEIIEGTNANMGGGGAESLCCA
jgi:DNA-directed RNA polymerase IV subunit 1